MKAKLITNIEFYGVTIPKGTISEIKTPVWTGDDDEYDYEFTFPEYLVAITNEPSMLVTKAEIEVIEGES